MSQERFEDLTRTLAKATSRREMLKGLAGAITAAVAGTLGIRGAQAAPLHGCCVFVCPDKFGYGYDLQVYHQCIRGRNKRFCSPPEVGCTLTNFTLVSKCSDCGQILPG
jgi:hypothetical protein